MQNMRHGPLIPSFIEYWVCVCIYNCRTEQCESSGQLLTQQTTDTTVTVTCYSW